MISISGGSGLWFEWRAISGTRVVELTKFIRALTHRIGQLRHHPNNIDRILHIKFGTVNVATYFRALHAARRFLLDCKVSLKTTSECKCLIRALSFRLPKALDHHPLSFKNEENKLFEHETERNWSCEALIHSI